MNDMYKKACESKRGRFTRKGFVVVVVGLSPVGDSRFFEIDLMRGSVIQSRVIYEVGNVEIRLAVKADSRIVRAAFTIHKRDICYLQRRPRELGWSAA